MKFLRKSKKQRENKTTEQNPEKDREFCSVVFIWQKNARICSSSDGRSENLGIEPVEKFNQHIAGSD